MKITNFLACEFANAEPSGKVNLIGAGLDRFYPDSFPVSVMFYLYLRCVPELNDVPGYKKGRIKLMGEDGLIEDYPIQILFTEEKPAGALIYKFARQFTAPGMFRFEASLEGTRETATWPTRLFPVSPPPVEGYSSGSA